MREQCHKKGDSFPDLRPDTIHLYSMRFCPFSERVRLVLTAKSIPHEIININLANKPEWLFEKSPAGKVPLLEHGDKIIEDSFAIVDYLDDTYPNNKLHPSDPHLRQQNDELIRRFGEISSTVIKCIFGRMEVDQFWPLLQEPLNYLEEQLINRKTPFFGGENPGMVDYMMWPWFERIPALNIIEDKLTSFPNTKFPEMAKWIDQMVSNLTVKSTMRTPELFALFFSTLRQGKPNYNIGL